MIKNYLLIALRNLLKNKSYVLINTFGLGVSLACCITAYILVAYNIEFDNHFKDEDVRNIYRVHANVTLSGGNLSQAISAPRPVGPSAAEDFAGIKSFVRFAGSAAGGASVSYVNDKGDVESFGEFVSYADSNIFRMFDLPLVSGSHDAFEDLLTVYLDERTAEKYFDEEDPIGKVLTFGFSRGVEKQFVVGGVLAQLPLNTSIVPAVLIRFEHFEELRQMDSGPWGDWNVPVTFFELENPENAAAIAKLFDKFKPMRNEAFAEQEVTSYSLVPFKTPVNPNDMTWSYLNVPVNIEPLVIFVVLALMILLIACFNLTNTSVALSANRLKEIGVRKSLGAYRSQIVSQFMMETIIVIVLSVFAGYMISMLIVPEFTAMWNLPYGMTDLDGINLVIMLISLVFLASIVAGLYPSFYSAKFETVSLLKSTVKFKGTNLLTRSLVAIQFAISVIVLIGGVVFIQNTRYQEAIKFGYDKEELLTIGIQSEEDYRKLLAKVQGLPSVKSIGVTEHHLGFSTYSNPVFFENVEYEVNHLEFGENYFETMEFNFLEGKAIDYNKKSESDDGVVVSKQLLKALDIQGNPIGQVITIRDQRKRIVGVVDDFVDNVFRSKDPEPFVFYATIPDRWRQVVVRADEENLVAVNEQIETIWKDLFPTKPYNSQFQEDILMSGLQQTNRNLKKIFLFLTVLGGLLSSAGIFSLASLNIAKRTKEIGIRKALGATVQNVVLLLNREFVIILCIAGVLGSVGGYFGTTALLDLIYAYHVPVTVIPILLSALAILIIGLVTTSTTIFRAAKSNPVDTLRVE